MSLYPIILDFRPEYLAGGPDACSLLLTPLGRGTILSEIEAILPHDAECVLVLPIFDATQGYMSAVAAESSRGARIAKQAEIENLIDVSEPSDFLLFVNPACHPIEPIKLPKEMSARMPAVSARHVVTIALGDEGTQECVHLDGEQRVRRIQRYYDGFTRLATNGVFCTKVSVAAMRALEDGPITCLTDLKCRLARRNIVANDVPLPVEAADLRNVEELLHVAERRARAECRMAGNRVILGRDCDVDPKSFVRGYVVVQDGARIEAGATVVGPATIGRCAVVQSGASLAHCVVMPATQVASNTRASASVVTANRVCRSARGATRSEPGGPAGDDAASRGWYPTIKAIAEGIVAALGLIVLSPLLGLVALLIKLESRGPVFFAHAREGRGGKPFRCLKFRTMCADADLMQRRLYAKSAVDGPQFKMEHDPRVTRVGKWLRSTNIDELPQLINVVLGQMSLIGPRPSPFRENQICVPWRHARLSVRPGITGLWQLCRSERDAGDFHQWIHFDMLYVKRMSAWLDLKILFGTLATLGGRWSIPASRLLPENADAEPILPDATALVPILSTASEHATRTIGGHQA